jgi:hypothetical protein
MNIPPEDANVQPEPKFGSSVPLAQSWPELNSREYWNKLWAEFLQRRALAKIVVPLVPPHWQLWRKLRRAFPALAKFAGNQGHKDMPPSMTDREFVELIGILCRPESAEIAIAVLASGIAALARAEFEDMRRTP